MQNNVVSFSAGSLVNWRCVTWLVLGFFAAVAVAQSETQPNALDSLNENQAKQDVRIAIRALKELHPALNKYKTAAEMDAAFAKFEARGNAAKSATELYLAATELAAAIECGHTMTNPLNQGGVVRAALYEAKNKLPVQLTVVESRWLVLASADVAVRAGDEILAINDVPAADVIAKMLPYARADGSSDGKRLRQLSHDRFATSLMDLVWPLLSPPERGEYRLLVRRSEGATANVRVAAMTFAARKSAMAAQGIEEGRDADAARLAWTLTIKNNVAVMRLPTFAFWNTKFDWKSWLTESFATLEREKAAHLIIDIRDTEGGDGAINRALLSHLLKAPYTWPETQPISAYERVPYILAKYLDTWDYGFFDRTGQVEKIGEKQFVFLPKTKVDRTIMPVSKPFAGKTYLLVSAENSSATFQLAHLAKLTGAATLIGQRTGGNLRGLNAGELTWVTLPNSGVSIDIPLLANNPIQPQPNASVEPDIVINKTFAARQASQDLEMNAALETIIRSR